MKFYKAKVLTGKKAAAWKAFAKYIKTRDALKTTGGTEACRCFTCGGVYPMERIDAGHAIAGRTSGILFDEDIVYGQCRTCNRTHGGEYLVFKNRLVELYGEEWWEGKLSAKQAYLDRTEEDYAKIAELYREKTRELLI